MREAQTKKSRVPTCRYTQLPRHRLFFFLLGVRVHWKFKGWGTRFPAQEHCLRQDSAILTPAVAAVVGPFRGLFFFFPASSNVTSSLLDQRRN